MTTGPDSAAPVEPGADPGADPGVTRALVAELGKKTSVSWVTVDTGQVGASAHPVWHVWLELDGDGGALYVVSGGTEQPLPGIGSAEQVQVTMRSKDNGGRLVTWSAAASVVPPDDPRWEPVTAALVSARLNLPDLQAAVQEWARSSLVTRLEPVGDYPESPASLPDDAHLGVPRPTRATTRGPLPKVLHRRVRRRPRLS